MTRLTGLALAAAIGLPVGTAAQTAPPNPLFDEPRLMDKAMTWVEEFAASGSEEPYDGLYPDFRHMITGAGWISVGPGYRQHVFGGEAVMDVSAALSWRAYKIAQGRLEFPHLAGERLILGAKALWQDLTQVRYFGLGADSRSADVSDYRIQASNVIGYAIWRPEPYLAVGATAGWLNRPSLSSSTGTFDRAEPDTIALHADDPAATLSRQPRYAHAELSIAADNRNHQSYPTDGGVVRFAWSTYRGQPAGSFTFDRYEGEAAYFRPLFGRSVLAARIWGVLSKTLEGRQVPFYLMPSLGGHNTLRGYADYRFHDRHLIVANLESRWALFEHIDTAVFIDAGNVANRWADLDLSRTSYGLGMRLHTKQATLARFEVARSTEGWRFLLKVTDPLRLARFTRRTAALPFVP
jgi:outer membrane protein assembly factor BamA